MKALKTYLTSVSRTVARALSLPVASTSVSASAAAVKSAPAAPAAPAAPVASIAAAIILTFSLACVGCIARYELPQNCNLDLEFHYEFDQPGVESLPQLVGNIAVYAFDQSTGLLADIIHIGREDIRRGRIGAELPDGTYTLVCWATGADDITAGGYFPAHMNDPEGHRHSDIRIGVTSYRDFRMMLDCNELPSYVRGDITPGKTNFDDLYFSIKSNVVVRGDRSIVVPFNFICDTNLLRVRVGGLDKIAATRALYTPNVFVTAPHELYNHDNSLSEYSRLVRFELPAAYLAPDTMAVDIKVHRLEVGNDLVRPVLLYLQDPDTGRDIIEPVDILAAILAATDSYGRHPYETQDDIDRQYEFDIRINLNELLPPGGDGERRLTVTVTVDGFTVVNLRPDI